jgi:hypothetical protein
MPVHAERDWIAETVAGLEPLATAKETAAVLRTSTRNLRRMIGDGRIRAFRPQESGSSPVLVPRGESCAPEIQTLESHEVEIGGSRLSRPLRTPAFWVVPAVQLALTLGVVDPPEPRCSGVTIGRREGTQVLLKPGKHSTLALAPICRRYQRAQIALRKLNVRRKDSGARNTLLYVHVLHSVKNLENA